MEPGLAHHYLRVRARSRRVPKRPTKVNGTEVIRVVHIRERARVCARAVVREAREVVPRDVVEVALHGAVPPVVVRAEPCGVPRGAARRAVEVRRRVRRVVGRIGCRCVEVRLLAVRAPIVVRVPADSPDPAEEARAADDREIAPGERGGVRRGGVSGERGDVVVGVNDEEGVGRGDGVCAVASFGEVVCGRDCGQEVGVNDHPVDLDGKSRDGHTIVIDAVAPGASTVNTDASVDFAAWLGEYLTLTPVKLGALPAYVYQEDIAERVYVYKYARY